MLQRESSRSSSVEVYVIELWKSLLLGLQHALEATSHLVGLFKLCQLAQALSPQRVVVDSHGIIRNACGNQLV